MPLQVPNKDYGLERTLDRTAQYTCTAQHKTVQYERSHLQDLSTTVVLALSSGSSSIARVYPSIASAHLPALKASLPGHGNNRPLQKSVQR